MLQSVPSPTHLSHTILLQPFHNPFENKVREVYFSKVCSSFVINVDYGSAYICIRIVVSRLYNRCRCIGCWGWMIDVPVCAVLWFTRCVSMWLWSVGTIPSSVSLMDWKLQMLVAEAVMSWFVQSLANWVCVDVAPSVDASLSSVSLVD